MNGKSIRSFISELYYNPEIEFEYKKNRYIISGYINSDQINYTLELCKIDDNEIIFFKSGKFREKVVESFEEAKIFDGKTIYEVESEITVLFG